MKSVFWSHRLRLADDPFKDNQIEVTWFYIHRRDLRIIQTLEYAEQPIGELQRVLPKYRLVQNRLTNRIYPLDSEFANTVIPDILLYRIKIGKTDVPKPYITVTADGKEKCTNRLKIVKHDEGFDIYLVNDAVFGKWSFDIAGKYTGQSHFRIPGPGHSQLVADDDDDDVVTNWYAGAMSMVNGEEAVFERTHYVDL